MRSTFLEISHGAGWTTRVHASPNLRGLRQGRRRRRRQPITRRNIQFRSLSSSDKVVEKRLQKSFILKTTSDRAKTSKLYNKKPLWWGQHKRGILRTNQATTRWTPTRKVPSITRVVSVGSDFVVTNNCVREFTTNSLDMDTRRTVKTNNKMDTNKEGAINNESGQCW